MTTVVNNPAPSGDSNGGSSMLIGVVVLIGFVLILVYFGLPVLRNMQPAQINIPAPQVVIPDKIDVNVTQPK